MNVNIFFDILLVVGLVLLGIGSVLFSRNKPKSGIKTSPVRIVSLFLITFGIFALIIALFWIRYFIFGGPH